MDNVISFRIYKIILQDSLHLLRIMQCIVHRNDNKRSQKMAYAYTVRFPNDGIIGVYSTMKKAESAWVEWIRDHNYNFTVENIVKKKNYRFGATYRIRCIEGAEHMSSVII